MTLLCHSSTPKVLIFGSQALDFDIHAGSEFRSGIVLDSAHAWILEALSGLCHYSRGSSKSIPALQDFAYEESLEGLSTWLRTGDIANLLFPLPNVILTPLVVASHLWQYLKFLDLVGQKEDQLSATFIKTSESLGLCTGLFAAAAVSCSATRTELERYGTVAIRLAMLVGAIVDAQDQASGGNRNFTISWSSPSLFEQARRIIESFPGTYISVIIDEKKATVTTRRDTFFSIMQELKDVGVMMTEINLRGRFHTEDHVDSLKALHDLCESNSDLQFPSTMPLVLPTRSNTDGRHILVGPLHHIITQSILVEQCDWSQAFSQLDSSTFITPEDAVVVLFGENGTPARLARKLGRSLLLASQIASSNAATVPSNIGPGKAGNSSLRTQCQAGVAVVGMSALFPGASDLEGLWQVLASGVSQHTEVPPDRFTVETAWRKKDDKKKWYGNFVEGYNNFDYKFFKKSPREMASTDPQHRLMLQVAYQAVEQSGYFKEHEPDRQIGCYIGLGLVDYERNVGCHPANAYTATGNLKSFAAGKISHYFGWTGPGLVVDTACSSSAVAVHLACQAILSGQVSRALAGGVNILTSPEWFQNLSGASFLSPTGQCKPFDSRADGYCRGEGVGAVFLKPLEAAIADGDQILGIIAATNVYQNENCTPITVPNALSLSDLFRNTIHLAGIEPKDISVVEAHGTGTPVGDPAEYEGISSVLGSTETTVSLGSVKGSIGHAEAASGIVALIKVLLMLNKGSIPPQASFQNLNPLIKVSPSDRIEIATSLKPWAQQFRAALINNYGASGSNACLVAVQGPKYLPMTGELHQKKKRPIWLTGLGEDSLRRYATALLGFLKRYQDVNFDSLCFQLEKQSNRNLQRALILGCKSTEDLTNKLLEFERGDTTTIKNRLEDHRPVIFCFGGQVSTFVGLPLSLYEEVAVFRRRLDEYDAVCLSLGLGSIFPHIFQKTPLGETVKLQIGLFGAQYASARTWMDCGIRPAALIGFSFGELTALCVSGILSLSDAVTVVAERARLIHEHQGHDTGEMLAVEGPRVSVEAICNEVNGESGFSVDIACFNGPTSFTLAGSTQGINLATEKSQAAGIRHKKLNVTHAFHCPLVEHLMTDLQHLGKSIPFRKATIPLEHAMENGVANGLIESSFFADHLRNPVYFHHAARRLSQKYPDAVWLEVGFNSTIANIAQKALENSKSCHFQPVNLENRLQGLTDATIQLWEQGVSATYWPHHAVQADNYEIILLPPYQFEKSQHWMPLLPVPSEILPVQSSSQDVSPPKCMWTFMGYQDTQECLAGFQINTTNEQYHSYVSSHIIAQTEPLCPSTLQLSICIDALVSLCDTTKVQPEAREIVSHAPMLLCPDHHIWIEAQRPNSQSWDWSWKISSKSSTAAKTPTLYASGRVIFHETNNETLNEELARFEYLTSLSRCQQLLQGSSVDEMMTGSKIYRRFSHIVQYGEMYRGLKKLVGKGLESAGMVVRSDSSSASNFLDPGLSDAFCQVAGIFINVILDETSSSDLFISNKIDRWFRSARPRDNNDEWEVFASHRRLSSKRYLSDVFVFDPRTGSLAEVFLGINYQLVPIATLRTLLSKSSTNGKASVPAEETFSVPNNGASIENVQPELKERSSHPLPVSDPSGQKPFNVINQVRDIIANLSGLDTSEIKEDADLAELGIDSLMGMELAREIEGTFSCSFDANQLMEITHFNQLVDCISTVLGITGSERKESPASTFEAAVRQSDSVSANGMHDASANSHSAANGIHDSSANTYSVANGVHDSSAEGNPTSAPLPVDGLAGLSASALLDTFTLCRKQTDRFIREGRFDGYSNQILPKSNTLCTVLIADAFEQLGCSLKAGQPGEKLDRISHLPRHKQFVDWLYDFLEKDAKLIITDGDHIERTAVKVPQKSARVLLEELASDGPDHIYDHQITYLVGNRLADCLAGKADAVQILFGSPEGREIASNMYGKSPINRVWVQQMQDILRLILLNGVSGTGKINILEMGAGTGGTSAGIVSLLHSLGLPVQYTITDLSLSLVTAARKRFKEYKFVRTQVLDIEKQPPEDLLQSQLTSPGRNRNQT